MRTSRASGVLSLLVLPPLLTLLLTQCSADPEVSRNPANTSTSGSGGQVGGNAAGTSSGSGGKFEIGLGGTGLGGKGGSAGSGGADTSGCGDGVLQAATLGEACDDGNSVSGDGCSADCLVIEQNFDCLVPGQACKSNVKCGDGRVSGAETCDDGNSVAKDGCDAACLLEAGWICPDPGELCLAAKCGDGIVAGVEQCDDDDATPTGGDGCSATCSIEVGYVCETAGAACRKAICGDGVVEGGEPCDDKNDVVGDGCSPGCEAEPVCDKPTDADGCSSRCGDGLLLVGDAEECDDGNKRDGDGCSAACKKETGYTCVQQLGTLPPSITIPFVFRDFIALPSPSTAKKRHPDFQSGCSPNTAVVEGIVGASLDPEGKPLNSGNCNLAAACTVKLDYGMLSGGGCSDKRQSCPSPPGFDGCDELHAQHPLADHPADDPFKFWYRDTDGVNKSKLVQTPLTLSGNAYSFASNALYPFDNDGWVATGDEVAANTHNYGFTSEVRRWFEFKGGELLTFKGDDDVWVFINGKLALDIGGVHGTVDRTVRLNADGSVACKQGVPGVFDNLTDCPVASRPLGLVVGNVYEIALFHAERHTDASTFRLTLTGFVSAKSQCSPVCGDGTQTPGEACDDGAKNDDNLYGGCSTKCRRGPRCGDSKVQAPQEDCDDGANVTPYSPTKKGCAPGCKSPAYCGDGNIDSLFGEACDDGTNAGNYGGCKKDCTLAPRCGDAKIDEPMENCDDGNAVSNDGCSSKCRIEQPI